MITLLVKLLHTHTHIGMKGSLPFLIYLNSRYSNIPQYITLLPEGNLEASYLKGNLKKEL